MYTIIKQLEISAAHKLTTRNRSKCENLHGHNWLIKVHMQAETLNEDEMVCDFSFVKSEIKDRMDHKNLNDLIPQPTAENIAKYICDLLGEQCIRVEVQETATNIAIYERK